jgi:YjbE family integral membrane protein
MDLMTALSTTSVWTALGLIMFTNILLSGDNAVVIAMASRNLAPRHQKRAIFWGSAAAIIMRILLTIIAVKLLGLPYLKIIGGILLIYIGVQLMAEADDDPSVESSPSIFQAIKTILIADLVMSLDNVVAVAAAAEKGPEEFRMPLILLGLVMSIPLIIFASTLLLKVMERYPIIITIGAALLGYLAGEMFVTDPAVTDTLHSLMDHPNIPFQILGILLVVGIGALLKKKHAKSG